MEEGEKEILKNIKREANRNMERDTREGKRRRTHTHMHRYTRV